MADSREYRAIQKHYSSLVDNLGKTVDPARLARKLRERCVVGESIVEAALVVGVLTGSQRVGPVIAAVLAQIKLKANIFHTFMNVLKSENSHLADVISEYYTRSLELHALEALSSVSEWEELGHQLNTNAEKLSQLSQCGREPQYCREQVVSEWLEEDKEASWEKLCGALERMGRQAEAVAIREQYLLNVPLNVPPTTTCEDEEIPMEEKYDGEETPKAKKSYESEIAKILDKGDVPLRPSNFVERPEESEKIRNELRKLEKNDGWVIVSGMPGHGKTVLAAEALRDPMILRIFDGNVFWCVIGRLKGGDEDLQNQLIKKIGKFLKKHGVYTRKDDDLEDMANKFQLPWKYKKSLLILDDVWSPDVAKLLQCFQRTMVTTRYSEVACKLKRSVNKYKVSIRDGLSDEAGEILLHKWSRMDVLPSSAAQLLKYCRGSPLAISLIGARLQDVKREKVWEDLANKLENESVSGVRLEADREEWEYEYKALSDSMNLSLECLDEKLQSLFKMLAVFEHNTAIPRDALAVVWDRDLSDTNESMKKLCDYSLVQQHSQDAYFIHDIVVDFLKKKYMNKMKELHEKVLEQYSIKCAGKFAFLPDDGYVYQHLPDHALAANNKELFCHLMTSLDWLISEIVHLGGSYVLSSLEGRKSHLPSEALSVAHQLQLFVGNNMEYFDMEYHDDEIYYQPEAKRLTTREEIIQLALFQPESSEVYHQAITLASEATDYTWFNWTNRQSSKPKSTLKVQMHKSAVLKCQYQHSQDETKSCVLTASASEVKVWNPLTGERSFECPYDESALFHVSCAISHSGNFVITGTEKLKVWDVSQKQLLMNIKLDSGYFTCLDISPDESLVFTGDNMSMVKIWKVSTANEIAVEWSLDDISSESSSLTEIASSCAFSPSGDRVVTASYSGTIKLWSLDGTLDVKFASDDTEKVMCSVFSNSGKTLATVMDGHSTVMLWEVATGKREFKLNHKSNIPLTCNYSHDDSLLITACKRGTIMVWSESQTRRPRKMEVISSLQLYDADVVSVSFSPSAKQFLAAFNNGYVSVHSVDNIADTSLESEDSGISDVHYNDTLKASFNNGVPTIVCEDSRKILHGKKLLPFTAELHVDLNSCTLSSAGSNDAVLSYSYEMKDKNEFVQTYTYILEMYSTCLHSGDKLDVKKVWSEKWSKDVPSRRFLYRLSPTVIFSPDATKVLVSHCGQCKVWSVAQEESVLECNVGSDNQQDMFFSDSIRVASMQSRSVKIWSTETGEILVNFTVCSCHVSKNSSRQSNEKDEEHSWECSCLGLINISKDGSKLVACNEDYRDYYRDYGDYKDSAYLSVWDTRNGKKLREHRKKLSEHRRELLVYGRPKHAKLERTANIDQYTHCCLSADGSYIAAARVYIYSLLSQKYECFFELWNRHGTVITSEQEGEVVSMSFTADNQQVTCALHTPFHIKWYAVEDGSITRVMVLPGVSEVNNFILSPDCLSFVGTKGIGFRTDHHGRDKRTQRLLAVSAFTRDKLSAAASSYSALDSYSIQNRLEEKPTMPELLSLSCNEKKLRILNKIGDSYCELGIYLLKDDTGEKVELIRQQNPQSTFAINQHIMRKWLSGEGLKPVSWSTLIQQLKRAELNELADNITDILS